MARTVPGAAARRWVAAAALALLAVAAAPAGAQPLGAPQQVSFSQPLTDMNADATQSAIAYGSGRSLIVWHQSTSVPNRGGSRIEIMGRFVNGASAPISDAFVISQSTDIFGRNHLPDVAYDSIRNRFFVVWQSSDVPDPGDDARGFISTSDIIRGAAVEPDGTVHDSFEVSQGEGFHEPATAYNATADEFLVAYGDNNSEVHVRRVKAGLPAVEGDSQNITTGAGFGQLEDRTPRVDVAFDGTRWLVVFEAQPAQSRGPAFDPTVEIYGRAVDASLNLTPLQRISHNDPNGFDDWYYNREPSVAADTPSGGFVVVYSNGTQALPKLPGPLRGGKGRFELDEVFARRVGSDGTPAGDAHQVSDPNPENEFFFASSRRPDIWHDHNADQFLVSWGQEISTELDVERVDGRIEYELFAKKVNTSGEPLEPDRQMSNHRPDDTTHEFDGDIPAVTYDAAVCDYVVSWTGEETAEGSNEKEEIWNRPYDAPGCPAQPPQQGAAGSTAAAGSAGVVARICTSRRTFTIRLVRRRDREYEFALVKVNGQEVNVTYGDRVTAPVNLVGLPKGRFSVDIEVRLANGRQLKGVRRYFTCDRKLPPSNGLEEPGAL